MRDRLGSEHADILTSAMKDLKSLVCSILELTALIVKDVAVLDVVQANCWEQSIVILSGHPEEGAVCQRCRG